MTEVVGGFINCHYFLIAQGLEEFSLVNFYSFNLVKCVYLMAHKIVCLQKTPCRLQTNVLSVVIVWSILYISIRLTWLVVSFKSTKFLLIHWVLICQLCVEGSPTLIVVFFIYIFSFTHFCPMHLIFSCAYNSTTVTSSWRIDSYIFM